MMTANRHPTHKGLRFHGIWLMLITFALALTIWVVVWEEVIKPKKENYTDLWKRQADIDRRLKRLENQ